MKQGGKSKSDVLVVVTLALIGLISFFIRMFAVLRFESVIHEFDPYFNFRTTKFLSKEGYMEFWNWFDEASWYPLGRVIGQTLFPGLMTTGYLLHRLLNSVGIPIDIRDVCVFVAPIFAVFCAWTTYALCEEATGNRGAGLIAALFIGVVPSYLSRSTAGGFDNEAIAIFTLVFSFYTFLRAMNRGTLTSILLANAAYFYMVTAWGGYVFVTNIVAIYVTYLIFMKAFTDRHFVVYTTWYVIGTLWCFNIPFVEYAAIKSSEHMSSHGAFFLALCWKLRQHLLRHFSGEWVRAVCQRATLIAFFGFQALFAVLLLLGKTRWSGRSMTLLDPTYAAKHVPIIASVSEHQPTTWAAFHFDLGTSFVLVPAGLWLALTSSRESAWFLAVFGVFAAHFAGVMNRLMLVLAPAAACLAGVGGSEILKASIEHLDNKSSEDRLEKDGKQQEEKAAVYSKLVGLCGLGMMAMLCYRMVVQGVWSSASVYSSPSIVTSGTLNDGSRLIMDDFREAYSWFRDNTHPNARIMSWWDYGYQACYMANRTIIVDNNTWNNTHIATVGLAMGSDEQTAYPILQHLDVDYVFVVFGGVARYSGDDLNKFLWMVRIGSGVFDFMPKEQEYYTPQGRYDLSAEGSRTLQNSLMYRMSYYNFHNNSITGGYDVLRRLEVPKIAPFTFLEEAYTTSSWIVRIYKVKKASERLRFGGRRLVNVLEHPPGLVRGG